MTSEFLEDYVTKFDAVETKTRRLEVTATQQGAPVVVEDRRR